MAQEFSSITTTNSEETTKVDGKPVSFEAYRTVFNDITDNGDALQSRY